MIPRTTSFLLLATLLFQLRPGFAQQNWRTITSVEDICAYYPETIETMFGHFNLDRPGLAKVRWAYNDGDLVGASYSLLEYYKNGTTAQHLRREQPITTDETVAEADTILTDVFVIQNVRGKVPTGGDGHRDWYYKGPNNDREWAWLSNRHTQINSVLTAYFETGNPKYATYIDLFLRDFIIKSAPYPAVKRSTSIWRGLEVAARAKVWSRIFYALINSDYLSPATQLLMLSSLPDHAHYNRNFHGGNNWLTMEISALATVATNFPEYTESTAWLDYTIETMTESMREQVYSDGVQTELTSHYHNVSLRNFELFKDICDRANKTLPDFFNQTLESMYRYIAQVVRPTGFRILNNDGDRGSDRDIILRGAERFANTNWEYIATNGASGTKPSDGPSYFYPWAGQLVSRSGYDTDAHWSFFDVGPWGSGHQHNDKLHLSVTAYGRDLLVDAGRFAYTGEVAEKFRPYAKSSAAHNVLLIDGKGQEAGPTHAEEPLNGRYFKITERFDYASQTFDAFEAVSGEVKHVRSVVYVRGEFWIVVDKVVTDRPREISALWHWHPSNLVEKVGSTVKTNNQRGNLAVTPVSTQTFAVEFTRGQEVPKIQGWYSPEYNLFEPNIASSYSTTIEGSTILVWLLLPSEKEPPSVEATIIAEDSNEVKIAVRSENKSWQLTIPFMNSAGVMVAD